MQYKKKLFLIIAINVFLILLFILLSIPAYKYLSKKDLGSNNFVKNQIIINPDLEPPKILDRSIKINLVAKVDKSLGWEFEPIQESIEVRIGESNIVKYKGKNISNQTITSTANFIVEPEAVQAYLIKTECFCFIEQTLESGESQIFTMVFYIDPDIDTNFYFDDLKDLVFTYEFSEYKS